MQIGEYWSKLGPGPRITIGLVLVAASLFTLVFATKVDGFPSWMAWVAQAIAVLGGTISVISIVSAAEDATRTLQDIKARMSMLESIVSKPVLEQVAAAAYRLRQTRVEIEYLDNTGNRVRITKFQTIEFLKDGVISIDDPVIMVDPRVPTARAESFRSSIGEVTVLVERGGWNVTTTLPSAQTKGSILYRQFSYLVIDSYTRLSEDFVFSLNRPCDDAEISVKLIEGLKFVSAAGSRILGAFSDSMPNCQPVIDNLGQFLYWRLDRPLLGEKYLLKWVVDRKIGASTQLDLRQGQLSRPQGKDGTSD